MSKRLALLGAAVAATALSACADYYGGGYYDRYYDGYYDGYYGPYSGGYWASDGYFYYSDRQRNYHRDDGHHFRHQRFDGGTRFHGDRHGDSGRGDRHDRGDRGRDHD